MAAGVLAALAVLILGHAMPGDNVLSNYGLMMLLAYVIFAALGLVYYRIYNDRLRPPPGKRPTNDRRVDCHLVEIDVDSYEFEDKTGKDFDPDAAFADKPVVWPAHVDPPSFVFLPGKAFRDVNFHTDAPDDPGPSGQFNINVRQGGEPSGGVTLTITRGE